MWRIVIALAAAIAAPLAAQVSYPPPPSASQWTGKGIASLGPSSPTRASIMPATGTGSRAIANLTAGTVITVQGQAAYSTATIPGSLTFWIMLCGQDVASVSIGNLVAGVSGSATFGPVDVLIGDGGTVTAIGPIAYQTSATAEQNAWIVTSGAPTVTLGSTCDLDVQAQWSMSQTNNWLQTRVAWFALRRGQ